MAPETAPHSSREGLAATWTSPPPPDPPSFFPPPSCAQPITSRNAATIAETCRIDVAPWCQASSFQPDAPRNQSVREGCDARALWLPTGRPQEEDGTDGVFTHSCIRARAVAREPGDRAGRLRRRPRRRRGGLPR